jgi:hypothetical protein
MDYFLDLWDARDEPNRYINDNGDKPEELLLRNSREVSLQAFTHVVERYYFEDKVSRLTRDFVNARAVVPGWPSFDDSPLL